MLQNSQKQIDNIINKNNYNRVKKRCMLKGIANSRKSTVIHEMVRRIVRNFGDGSIRVAAYIGTAAINVDGNTLLSLFRISVQSYLKH